MDVAAASGKLNEHRRTTQVGLGLSGLVVLLGLWWLATRGGDEFSLSRRFTPEAAFASLFEILGSSDLLRHTLVSLKRVLIGLGLAVSIGVPIGVAVGSSFTIASATGIAFQFLRMISPLSWMPIAVMAFGIGDRPIYFLLAFAAVWPILLNTAAGVRQLDPNWLELGHSMSASRSQLLRHIVLPGILGHVLTGVRLAIGVLWIVLVPCEMLGVSAGLGYAILDTRDRLAYSELIAMVLLIGFLGFALDTAARLASRRWVEAA
jgi:NitT/TauT family transport system permease protein